MPSNAASRIVHISDVHIGDAAQYLLDSAVDAIARRQPDLIVLSGDITQAGRRREYAAAAEFLAKMPAPVVAAPGNHDAPVFDPFARIARPYRRFRRLDLLDRWHSANKSAGVAAISTARAIQARLDWSQGVYRLEALRAAIAAVEACLWRVIVAHHPPVTHEGAWVRSDARRGREALDILGKHERMLLLCGHAHGFKLVSLGPPSSAFIVAPSLASGRPRDGGHGFVIVDLAPDRADISVHLKQGNDFVEARREKLIARGQSAQATQA
jgi:3',5'-cyclic AMP phosphodiesterase CpdA